MAFDKEEKKFLENMFKKNNELLFDGMEPVINEKIQSNNSALLEGIEDLIDYKIKSSEERTEERDLKRHSQVMDTLDAFAGELKASREERTVGAHQISRNTKRIEKLEQAVFKTN